MIKAKRVKRVEKARKVKRVKKARKAKKVKNLLLTQAINQEVNQIKRKILNLVDPVILKKVRKEIPVKNQIKKVKKLRNLKMKRLDPVPVNLKIQNLSQVIRVERLKNRKTKSPKRVKTRTMTRK